jgi:hypothetical protein
MSVWLMTVVVDIFFNVLTVVVKLSMSYLSTISWLNKSGPVTLWKYYRAAGV